MTKEPMVAEVPHNVGDLYLAPVALAVDDNLAVLSALTADELVHRVALETNRDPVDAAGRRDALLQAVTQLVTTHDWAASWDDRGLRLTHGDHTLVLGLGPSLREYADL